MIQKEFSKTEKYSRKKQMLSWIIQVYSEVEMHLMSHIVHIWLCIIVLQCLMWQTKLLKWQQMCSLNATTVS